MDRYGRGKGSRSRGSRCQRGIVGSHGAQAEWEARARDLIITALRVFEDSSKTGQRLAKVDRICETRTRWLSIREDCGRDVRGLGWLSGFTSELTWVHNTNCD